MSTVLAVNMVFTSKLKFTGFVTFWTHLVLVASDQIAVLPFEIGSTADTFMIDIPTTGAKVLIASVTTKL